MPTNRAGDLTATQAPSAAPQPEGTITQALPADGDPPNASTYAQAYKVCADFIDWLMKPRAKLSDWAKWIMSWRSGGGHKRLVVDHFGYPMGRIVSWRDDWSIGAGVSGTRGPVDATAAVFDTVAAKLSLLTQDLGNASTGVDLAAVKGFLGTASGHCDDVRVALMSLVGGSPWRCRTLDSGSGDSFVTFFQPDSGTVQGKHRYVGLGAADTVGNYALLYRVAPCNYDNDLHVAFEWEAQLEATGMGGTLTACMGLCDENAFPPTVGGSAADYVVFEKAPTGNWFIRYRSAAGTAQGVDTTVAATTNWTRFRIEFHGTNVAESAGRAVRCYINGTQVGGDITSNVPAATAKAAPHFSVTTTSGGASGLGIPLRIGPARIGHNLYGADVA
jgi:hypothetical protein